MSDDVILRMMTRVMTLPKTPRRKMTGGHRVHRRWEMW